MEGHMNDSHRRDDSQLPLRNHALDHQHLIAFDPTEHQGFTNLLTELLKQWPGHRNHINPGMVQQPAQFRPQVVATSCPDHLDKSLCLKGGNDALDGGARQANRPGDLSEAETVRMVSEYPHDGGGPGNHLDTPLPALVLPCSVYCLHGVADSRSC